MSEGRLTSLLILWKVVENLLRIPGGLKELIAIAF